MRRLLVIVPLAVACGSKPLPAAVQADGSSAYGGMRISAPIVPDSAAFAAFTDPTAYGKLSASAKAALVQQHTFSFAQLLTSCAASDPSIVTAPHTPAEYDANYAAVAKCAYATLGPSPAWVPQLVADVDVCSAKYADVSWHEPSTAEIIDMPVDYQAKLKQSVDATGATQATFANLRMYALSVNVVEVVDADAEPISLSLLQPPVTELDPDPIGVRCVFYDGT